MFWRLYLLALFTPALCGRLSLAETPRGEAIDIGLRAAGAHRGDAPPLVDAKTIVLDDLPLEWSERFDAQAGTTRWVRGVSLARLLELGPSSELDLILLHFANGMIVPVPRDGSEREVLIAREMRWTRAGRAEPFPEMNSSKTTLSSRTITFAGNKAVVASLDHPFVRDASSFSPWAHVDTLTEVELVDRAAWEAQFDAGGGAARQGRDVFLARCQYCHGVFGVGATFGWDFAEPTPLYEYRSPKSLYPHVRFANPLAAEKGARMPNQSDVVPQEIEWLWSWMKAITIAGPHPYTVK